ncbi:unnamed protein product, partial [marine sediment metagenome]
CDGSARGGGLENQAARAKLGGVLTIIRVTR